MLGTGKCFVNFVVESKDIDLPLVFGFKKHKFPKQRCTAQIVIGNHANSNKGIPEEFLVDLLNPVDLAVNLNSLFERRRERGNLRTVS